MANDFDESSANEEASKDLSWWYSADVLSRDKSDKTAKRIRRISITDRLLRHPGRLSMVYFGALIIIVTGLLLLPISTSDIIFTNFPIAFFTAVSALSTCGIPVVNTGEYWSMFGQVVVLFSIQFGGLGVMTFASMYVVFFILAVITTISEREHIHAKKKWRIITNLFTFPIFMMTYIPITVAALFKKVEWVPTKHDIAVNFDDVMAEGAK